MCFSGGGGGAAAEAGPVAVAKTEFDVCLTSFGEKKLDMIKLVREVTGLALKEAKEAVEALGVIKASVKTEEAESLKKKIEDAGGKCELR